MSVILGAGRVMGERVVPVEEIAATAGVTPEWISERSGITRIHARTKPLSQLASEAANLALTDASVDPADIGLVIVATCTADYVLPSMAAAVCRDLGISAMAFDVQANCTGFVDAFYAASRMDFPYALVIGAEALYEFAEPTDIESILFVSDGAGAVVLGRGGSNVGAFSADGSNYESVRCKRDGRLTMQGLATWKQTVTHMPQVCRDAVAAAGWDQPDLVIFHQANLRMMEFLLTRLGWPKEISYTNVQRVGNSGSASIPVAIADARAAGLLHGRILFAGVGAGFTFGAVTVEQP